MSSIRFLKNGTVISYLNDEWEPVKPEEATVVKIVTRDGKVVFGRTDDQAQDAD